MLFRESLGVAPGDKVVSKRPSLKCPSEAQEPCLLFSDLEPYQLHAVASISALPGCSQHVVPFFSRKDGPVVSSWRRKTLPTISVIFGQTSSDCAPAAVS